MLQAVPGSPVAPPGAPRTATHRSTRTLGEIESRKTFNRCKQRKQRGRQAEAECSYHVSHHSLLAIPLLPLLAPVECLCLFRLAVSTHSADWICGPITIAGSRPTEDGMHSRGLSDLFRGATTAESCYTWRKRTCGAMVQLSGNSIFLRSRHRLQHSTALPNLSADYAGLLPPSRSWPRPLPISRFIANDGCSN